MVILGVAAGALFGLILSYNLMTGTFFSDNGTSTSFIVPWSTIIVTILAAVIAALLMSWLPARQASRVHRRKLSIRIVSRESPGEHACSPVFWCALTR